MSGRKLARRACDACKIRKIKCSETTPCDGCKGAKIPCTWLKQAQPRGPRRLRDATLQEIRKAQDILQSQSQEAVRRGLSRSAHVNDPDPPPQPSSEIGQLVLYLCVYRVHLYPVWPIIKIERLIASLQSESPDVEVFALAYALAAATATRTQSTDLSISQRNHAQLLEEKCQAARSHVPPGRRPNLTTVRIAFFLHIYYDSIDANGMKSMLYLREAVTIATMIGLHREAYYVEVPAQEREIRRRVLWLLFITERVISVLYQQPITLRTRIELPSTTDTDEVDVLNGFRLLVRLMWKLDAAGLFSTLDELDAATSPSSNGMASASQPEKDYATLIRVDFTPGQYVSPVQSLDLYINQCWFQVINVRLQQGVGLDLINLPVETISNLFSATRKATNALHQSPTSVIEAHGIALQLKISTIVGAFQELLSLGSWNSHGDILQECSLIAGNLDQVMRDKVHEVGSPKVTTPLSADTSSFPVDNAPSPSRRGGSKSSNRHIARSPDVPQGFVQSFTSPSSATNESSYLVQDFATTNNYEGLFNAVELAGVESSDSVEDLFSNASLDHYTTFDDNWMPPSDFSLNQRDLSDWRTNVPDSAFGHG